LTGDFACPFCRSAVRYDERGYLCPQCARLFPIAAGTADFSTREHYWNQLTPEQMRVLLDITRSHGYRYAIENILGRFNDPELVRYVLGANRADFRTVLPLASTSHVAELGAGWGAVACGLAPHCASVTALDTNPFTLEFIKMRAQEEGLSNLATARIDPLDDGRLPFADDALDAVLMNGVLEYVGSATDDCPPAQAQIRCLSEVRRVLKPGGVLYVGIENRFGYLYFLGTRDHGGLRYTSLMPRALAGWVARMRCGVSYRTYTYSYRGYRALLKQAGFRAPTMFIAVPNYRDPRFIVPADDDRAITYLVRRYASYLRRRSWRWAAGALFGHTPPHLCGALARALSDSFLMVAEPAA